jgi:hypothetical protein
MNSWNMQHGDMDVYAASHQCCHQQQNPDFRHEGPTPRLLQSLYRPTLTNDGPLVTDGLERPALVLHGRFGPRVCSWISRMNEISLVIAISVLRSARRRLGLRSGTFAMASCTWCPIDCRGSLFRRPVLAARWGPRGPYSSFEGRRRLVQERRSHGVVLRSWSGMACLPSERNG